ncbi:hypothetical protein [Poseidonibacter ostreae]|uniref:Uncharacterized protein n=1 Tax=Poseidonibacter ostreae TaxID=2654171 RepID=A0A6L4WWH7_9BACT|nr:hypothetical protein [Poseidonibacter ostreae]KAB7889567.1 hypothetical protein GBG19_05790 [Poseidonibacter ostreae]
MKKILTTIIILGTVAFANSQNVMEKNTELTVLSGEYSKDFAKNVNKLVKESGVKELYKKRLEENARIAEKQAAMKSKYKLDTTQKSVSKYELVKARTIQAKKAELRAKNYFSTKYKRLDTKICDELKDAQIFKKSVCKAKKGLIDESLSDLDSILKVDARAYCMKSMVRLLKNSSEALSETTKDVILIKLRGFKSTNSCKEAFKISSSK